MKKLVFIFFSLIAHPCLAQEILISFGGDVNFAQSRVAPNPYEVTKFGRYPIDYTTEFISHEWNGDLNFINVETVVSENDYDGPDKTFVFRSHPENFDHLIALGVNVFSLANNHAYDHGYGGIEQTLDYFTAASEYNPELLFAGLGNFDGALMPCVIEISGYRVAFGAIGIGSQFYAASSPTAIGMATLGVGEHYDILLQNMATIDADLKIISIHYGAENQTYLDSGQRDLFLRAVEEGGAHLVLGHHPHVARAVEATSEYAIFYSLGNLLFVGGAVQDYGLLGKAYFDMSGDSPRLSALEAIPLTNVHLSPRSMSMARAEATINNLNRLSEISAGPLGASFDTVDAFRAPRGLACFGGPYGQRAHRACCALDINWTCGLPEPM